MNGSIIKPDFTAAVRRVDGPPIPAGTTVASVADRVADAERIGIVLADDHAMIRGGLRRVLDAETDLLVVAEAGDVEQALRLTREHQPRIVVLDLNMPGPSTLDAIPEFLDAAPRCGVLILTMESSPGLAQRALGAGAAGYVLKEAAETELVEAIRSLLAKRTYLDPALGARLATMGAAAAPAVHGISRRAPELAVGSVFAGHRIEGVLGRGGMGIVFRATDLTLDRTVALKLIAPEAATDRVFRARFRRESRLAAALDHPHVVQVFHAGQSGGCCI